VSEAGDPEAANVGDEASLSRSLRHAAMTGDVATVRMLLSNENVDVNAADDSGATALSLAVAHGRADVVASLLARDDIDVNAKDVTGSTPLARAAGQADERVVAMLLARPDIDVNLVDVHRVTPLHRAVAAGSSAIVAQLLSIAEANVDITSRPFGVTPLEEALERGHDDVVELLRHASPQHSFGDVLSPADDYVDRPAPDRPDLIPHMPYDDEPWPRPM